MAEHKGFDPTPKKLKKLRTDGQLAKAASLPQAIAFLMILSIIINSLHYWWSILPQMLEYCFSASFCRLDELAVKILVRGLIDTSVLLAIVLLIGSLCATFVDILQTGFEWHLGQLAPKPDRLSLSKGFQRIISGIKKCPLILMKLIVAFLIIGLSAFSIFKAAWLLGSAGRIIPRINSWIYWEAAILIVIAISEYLFIRRQFINRHSMSLEEIKKEIKDEEGDPHIRAHRKALHEAMVMQEMVKRVRASKVIIIDE